MPITNKYPVGKVQMDGKMALTFARERYSFVDGYIQRGKNQLKVISAIIDTHACIGAAENYAKANENYQFNLTKIKGFHNIQITCFEGKWCMISKNRAPAIHFVIHHPKLRYALENMVLPIRDDEIE